MNYPTPNNHFHTVSAIRDDERRTSRGSMTQFNTGSYISDGERAELERKAAVYDELEMVTQCGHKSRYITSGEFNSAPFCLMCAYGNIWSLKGRIGV